MTLSYLSTYGMPNATKIARGNTILCVLTESYNSYRINKTQHGNSKMWLCHSVIRPLPRTEMLPCECKYQLVQRHTCIIVGACVILWMHVCTFRLYGRDIYVTTRLM